MTVGNRIAAIMPSHADDGMHSNKVTEVDGDWLL